MKAFKYLTLAASLLTLAACMPDDARQDTAKANDHKAGQVAFYAQALNLYSVQAQNAVVTSEQWKARALPEGRINTANLATDSPIENRSAVFLDNAVCEFGGEPVHMTWFKTADDSGNLYLHGLGNDRAGMSAAKIRQTVPRETFGIVRGGRVEMADGRTLTPSGGCADLGMPQGSAVLVAAMSYPVEAAKQTDKEITRATACPAGQEGNRLESVRGTFTDTGIFVAGRFYASEYDVMADNALSWSVMSDNCTTPSQALKFEVEDAGGCMNVSSAGGGYSTCGGVSFEVANIPQSETVDFPCGAGWETESAGLAFRADTASPWQTVKPAVCTQGERSAVVRSLGQRWSNSDTSSQGKMGCLLDQRDENGFVISLSVEILLGEYRVRHVEYGGAVIYDEKTPDKAVFNRRLGGGSSFFIGGAERVPNGWVGGGGARSSFLGVCAAFVTNELRKLGFPDAQNSMPRGGLPRDYNAGGSVTFTGSGVSGSINGKGRAG